MFVRASDYKYAGRKQQETFGPRDRKEKKEGDSYGKLNQLQSPGSLHLLVAARDRGRRHRRAKPTEEREEGGCGNEGSTESRPGLY